MLRGEGGRTGDTNSAKKSRLAPLVTCYLAHKHFLSHSQALCVISEKGPSGIFATTAQQHSVETSNENMAGLISCGHGG